MGNRRAGHDYDMNTRGLIELVVLNIGYDLGILSARVFVMLVIMALVTTFMTAKLRRPADLAGKRLELLREIVPGLRSLAVMFISSPSNLKLHQKQKHVSVRALSTIHRRSLRLPS